MIGPALAIWDSEFPTNSFRLLTELPRIHDYRHKLEPIVCERSKLPAVAFMYALKLDLI